jgi:drug/metabolite transporter (DMT)-like permease
MVTGAQMTFGAVPLLATGLAVEGNGLAGADTTGILMLAYLILFATSLPFYAWFKALQYGEVGSVSVFTFTLPVLGVLSGWLLLGEPLSVALFFGMVMVAAGIVLVNRDA